MKCEGCGREMGSKIVVILPEGAPQREALNMIFGGRKDWPQHPTHFVNECHECKLEVKGL